MQPALPTQRRSRGLRGRDIEEGAKAQVAAAAGKPFRRIEMKLVKIAFAVAVAALVGPAYAFHDGGVAPCESCHTMHNSSAKETGALAPQMTNNDKGVGVTNPYLLQAPDPS